MMLGWAMLFFFGCCDLKQSCALVLWTGSQYASVTKHVRGAKLWEFFFLKINDPENLIHLSGGAADCGFSSNFAM